ncbi:MAG TPA: hypothetical protein VJC16_07935 [Candidatus Nanoarchaeia archaeon]|nr:hypothetical protein [Candidatus Nanoarchaeia archaeon]
MLDTIVDILLGALRNAEDKDLPTLVRRQREEKTDPRLLIVVAVIIAVLAVC